MLRGITKVFLFLSSYLPLWGILLLLHWSDWGWYRLLPIAAAVGGVAGIGLVRYWVRTTEVSSLRVEEAYRQDSDSVGYIVTYLVPFLVVAVPSTLYASALVLLFVTIMAVYVSSGLIYVNPMLTALGWRIYSVQTKDGIEAIVLTQRKILRKGDVLPAVPITETIWWESTVAG